jgi:alkylation response protein AidB-like acyl-CoA dehydrogenase
VRIEMWDAEGIFPIETLKQCASLGFGGMTVAEDVGGSALSRYPIQLCVFELMNIPFQSFALTLFAI